MPKVISNTTSLIALLKIDQLELLREIYQTIIIPEAVFAEIEADLVIIDETLGRRFAKHAGLKVTELSEFLSRQKR